MELRKRILAINPGSTSTKIAVYEGSKVLFLKKIQHSVEELSKFEKIFDQYEFRKNIILKELTEANIEISFFDGIIGRGGIIKPMEGGVYPVNEKMVFDLKHPMGEHVCNLGGVIAFELSKLSPECHAFIADPPCLDEMEDVARITGIPEITRRSLFHALNQKAVARRYAKENGKKYEELNYIVAHLGGGISVGAHKKGRIIDTNNGLNGDGPFAPERAGNVPADQLVDLCFSGKYTQEELHKKICGKAGLIAHLGTNNTIEIQNRIFKGDKHADLIYSAMAYQVSKEIGAMSTVLMGDVDVIILTGGVANCVPFIKMIKKRVKHIAKIIIYPGEDEMLSLATIGLSVLEGETTAKEYK